MRRYSSSRIRRTESLNTQKASGSPQNANKSSTMAYLQVPDAKPAASFDLKTESELSAKGKSDKISLLTKFFKLKPRS